MIRSVVLSLIALYPMTVAAQPVPDLSVDEARAQSLDALLFTQIPTGLLKRRWAQMTEAERVAFVQSGLQWARAFVDSADFAAAYAERREEQRPQPPAPDESIDEAVAAERERARAQLEEMRANLSLFSGEQRQAMEEALAQAEASLAEFEGNAELRGLQRQAIAQERQEREQQYQRHLDDWTQAMPEDPRELVARRIRDFLNKCSDVAFDAPLVASGGKQRFADPAHEARPWEWKLCYRAGRAPVDAARSIARAWLAELKSQ